MIRFKRECMQKKIGLAISGGAARGAAAIGTLKVLEQAGVKPDYVAGTSIGALIGALYCAGLPISTMEQVFCQQKWRNLLGGKRLERQIAQLTTQCGITTFDDLPIPFCCVATELSSCTQRVLSEGPIVQALRATMSTPVLFGTVTINGERLVDGFMSNNLPADVVQQMGADIVIAIDLQQITFWETTFSLKERTGIGGLWHWAVSHPEVRRYRENVKLADIYICPPLKAIDSYILSSSHTRQLIRLGEEEAMRHFDALRSIIMAQS